MDEYFQSIFLHKYTDVFDWVTRLAWPDLGVWLREMEGRREGWCVGRADCCTLAIGAGGNG